MKTYKNKNFTVEFTDERSFTVTNIFGDTYNCYLNENGKIVAMTAKGLGYAMKARAELNF